MRDLECIFSAAVPQAVAEASAGGSVNSVAPAWAPADGTLYTLKAVLSFACAASTLTDRKRQLVDKPRSPQPGGEA